MIKQIVSKNMKKQIVTIAAIAVLFGGSVAMSAPAHADDETTFDPILATVTNESSVYWEPEKTTDGTLGVGQTWYIVGQDTTGKYVKVYLTETSQVWALKSNFNLSDVTLPVVN